MFDQTQNSIMFVRKQLKDFYNLSIMLFSCFPKHRNGVLYGNCESVKWFWNSTVRGQGWFPYSSVLLQLPNTPNYKMKRKKYTLPTCVYHDSKYKRLKFCDAIGLLVTLHQFSSYLSGFSNNMSFINIEHPRLILSRFCKKR